MAKVKVLRSFKDIHTGVIYPIGSVFETTEGRIEEIRGVDASLIEVIVEAQEEPKTEAPVKRTRRKKGE